MDFDGAGGSYFCVSTDEFATGHEGKDNAIKLKDSMEALSISTKESPPPSPDQTLPSLPGTYPVTPFVKHFEFENNKINEQNVEPESRSRDVIQPPLLTNIEKTFSPRTTPSIPSVARDLRSPSPLIPPLPTTTEPLALPTASEKRRRTIAILHESCIKHKYSRLATARELASIVERPERCRASIIGITAAKARLDALRDSFDIVKSKRLGELSDIAVIDVHGETWPTQLRGLCNSASATLARGQIEIPSPYHSGDLFLCDGSYEALQGCIGALYDGIDAVMKNNYDKVHVSIRPPGHHCGESMPSGFCMINNVHIAIAYSHRRYGITRAAILDFDLHHGDGSQAIAWKINERTNQLEAQRSDSIGLRVGYFSIHDIYSFPCEDGARDKVQDASLCLLGHGQAIWNVHLERHSNSKKFETIYQSRYAVLLDKAAQFLSDKREGDKCMVFISAGFDACEYEGKGMQRHGFNVPVQFYHQFTKDAVKLANNFAGGKVFSVLEGGYADRAISSGSMAHMVGLSIEEELSTNVREWWTLPRLTLLDKCIKKTGTKIGDEEVEWISSTMSLLSDLIPLEFSEPSLDTGLFPATPRMSLRERKKPAPVNVVPPSTARKRSQRNITPTKARKPGISNSHAEESDVATAAGQLEREQSPTMHLAGLIQSMQLASEKVMETSSDDIVKNDSTPTTPTPSARKSG